MWSLEEFDLRQRKNFLLRKFGMILELESQGLCDKYDSEF